MGDHRSPSLPLSTLHMRSYNQSEGMRRAAWLQQPQSRAGSAVHSSTPIIPVQPRYEGGTQRREAGGHTVGGANEREGGRREERRGGTKRRRVDVLLDPSTISSLVSVLHVSLTTSATDIRDELWAMMMKWCNFLSKVFSADRPDLPDDVLASFVRALAESYMAKTGVGITPSIQEGMKVGSSKYFRQFEQTLYSNLFCSPSMSAPDTSTSLVRRVMAEYRARHDDDASFDQFAVKLISIFRSVGDVNEKMEEKWKVVAEHPSTLFLSCCFDSPLPPSTLLHTPIFNSPRHRSLFVNAMACLAMRRDLLHLAPVDRDLAVAKVVERVEAALASPSLPSSPVHGGRGGERRKEEGGDVKRNSGKGEGKKSGEKQLEWAGDMLVLLLISPFLFTPFSASHQCKGEQREGQKIESRHTLLLPSSSSSYARDVRGEREEDGKSRKKEGEGGEEMEDDDEEEALPTEGDVVCGVILDAILSRRKEISLFERASPGVLAVASKLFYLFFRAYAAFLKKRVSALKEYLAEQGFGCWMDAARLVVLAKARAKQARAKKEKEEKEREREGKSEVKESSQLSASPPPIYPHWMERVEAEVGDIRRRYCAIAHCGGFLLLAEARKRCPNFDAIIALEWSDERVSSH